VSTEKLPAVVEPSAGDLRVRRWRLVRDLVSFQVKLFVDGIKDLVLAPVSLLAGLYGIFTDRHSPGRAFYRVLEEGRRFDHWVDLFGATEHRALPPSAAADADGTRLDRGGLDGVVEQVETALRDQYAKGGLTAKAKDAIDKALDRVHDRRE
jgi:hypothetical protein